MAVTLTPADPPGAGAGSRPAPGRVSAFGRTLLRTWLLVSLGGGACGALSFSLVSLCFFFLTMPYGFALAACYGLPVTVTITIGLTVCPPRADPRRFIRTLALTGTTIAVVINGTTNVVVSVAAMGATWRRVPIGALAMPWVGNVAATFIAASGFVGWVCGATLAQRQLAAVGHPEAPARQALRRRRPWR